MNIDKEQLSLRYAAMDIGELLDLHGQGTLTEEAYVLLEDELRNRNERVPARPTTAEIQALQTGYWKAHWTGKKSLSSAFMQVFIVGNFVVLAAAMAASLFFYDAIGKSSTNFLYAMLLVLAIYTPYFTFSSVSVWRCSNNVRWKGWGIVARIIVIVWLLRYLQIVTGYA
jgi:hypothetical protein